MNLDNVPTKTVAITVIILFITAIGVLGFFGNGEHKKLSNGYKEIIEQVMFERFKAYDEKIALNTEFRVDEYIKLITKNAKKILKDPTDVKKSDIKLCISYLDKIPDKRKTEYIKAQIEIIINWDRQSY